MRLSAIVPVLNEERCLPRLLGALAALPGLAEVIVVDGGSEDRTRALAASYPAVRLLEAPRGRALQMNAGARTARGDVLFFLHADVVPPPDAARWIGEAFADPATVAGAFRTWTVQDGARRFPGPFLHLADLRSRVTALPYGDQGLFVRRAAFEEVGGFPPIPLMEDLEIARRLRALGRIRTVPACVRVSGRRFEARPFFYTLLVNLYPLLYRLGVPPRCLAALYRDCR